MVANLGNELFEENKELKEECSLLLQKTANQTSEIEALHNELNSFKEFQVCLIQDIEALEKENHELAMQNENYIKEVRMCKEDLLCHKSLLDDAQSKLSSTFYVEDVGSKNEKKSFEERSLSLSEIDVNSGTNDISTSKHHIRELKQLNQAKSREIEELRNEIFCLQDKNENLDSCVAVLKSMNAQYDSLLSLSKSFQTMHEYSHPCSAKYILTSDPKSIEEELLVVMKQERFSDIEKEMSECKHMFSEIFRILSKRHQQ